MDRSFADTIYLDSAATTLTPKRVVDAYCNALSSDVDIESIREEIASILKVTSRTIKFTRGTTNSLNKIAKHLKGKSVSLSISEHHSNLVPWQQYAKDLHYLDVDYNDVPNSDVLTIGHISNVLGSIRDIESIISKNRDKIIVIDGAQYPSHYNLDLSKIDCNFYAFSGHKMYGPTGIGILYDRDNVIEETYSNKQAIAGLLEAFKFIDDNRDKIEREDDLTKLTLKEFSKLPIEIVGPENRAPIISFSIKGLHPHDVASFLSDKNIAIRAGHHCAQPLLRSLNKVALSRVSFGVYNDKSDVEYLIDSMREMLTFFGVEY